MRTDGSFTALVSGLELGEVTCGQLPHQGHLHLVLDPLGEEILGQHLLVGGQVRRLLGGQDLVWKQELILLFVTFMTCTTSAAPSSNLREEKYVDIQVVRMSSLVCRFIFVIIKGLKIKHPNNSNSICINIEMSIHNRYLSV